MKKVIALGLATAFSVSLQGSSASGSLSGQQNWNTANTFLRFETPFQSASPERLALFNTEDLREKHRAAHNGDVQFVVIGGKNSSQADAAAYYMPGGLETLQFNASFDGNNGSVNTLETLWSGAQGGVTVAQFGGSTNAIARSTGTAVNNSAVNLSIQNDTAGIPALNNLGYVSNATGPVYTPLTNNVTGTTASIVPGDVVIGTGVANTYAPYDLTTLNGLVSNAGNIGNFNIDANKNLGIMRPWNFGVGYAPNVQMGEPVLESAFVSVITPELDRSYWGIGATWKQLLSTKDTGWFLELSTVLQRVTMNMNLNEQVTTDLDAVNGNVDTSWATSWATAEGYDTGDTVAPQNITQAFAQSAWQYGKLDGAQSVTRLADIELKLGYQFICQDNVMSNMFVGMVIPTGNKAQSEYLAEAIVGNGFHFGLMFGSTQEIQLDMGTETRWSMRSDTNLRYLFQNTQMRSFDTVSNGQWSRYMMVWPNYETEQIAEAGGNTGMRNYTPGINVFTQEMHVTPRAQARINNAIIVEHGSFKGEFGWNMLVRQAEEVSLVNAWQDNQVAFVDASNNAYSMFNITRTIYNDSYQSSPVQQAAGLSEGQYNAASVKSTDLNLDCAASDATFTNTPYLAIGYAFNEEKSSVFSIGVSYEMAATNAYINDWMLWGKFGFSF